MALARVGSQVGPRFPLWECMAFTPCLPPVYPALSLSMVLGSIQGTRVALVFPTDLLDPIPNVPHVVNLLSTGQAWSAVPWRL